MPDPVREAIALVTETSAKVRPEYQMAPIIQYAGLAALISINSSLERLVSAVEQMMDEPASEKNNDA